MVKEKISYTVPDITLHNNDLVYSLGCTDALTNFANSLLELKQKAYCGALDVMKLYFDKEKYVSLSQLAINDSFNKICATYENMLPKIYDWGVFANNVSDYAKLIGQFTINTQELFKIQEHILKLFEPIKIETFGIEETFSELHQRLNDMIQAIPDEDYNVLFKDTEYTKSDVLDELDVFVQTNINSTNEYSLIWQDDNLSLKQKKDKILEVFYTKHPAIYMMVFICSMLCAIYGCKEMGENFLLPMFKNAIVALEGNQDIYFVDVEDGARLYQYADTESDIIMCVNFTEQVEVIDEIKFWSQVIYLDEDGNEIIGWIAKRNLVSYKDWKYEANKMYSDVE